MADQSRTSRFRAQFESALRAYQRETSITLAEHSLAIQLQSFSSVESIIVFLQNEARAFSDLPRSDIIMKSIESTVSILSAISAAPSLDGAISLVRQNALIGGSTYLTGFYSYYPRQTRYMPASVSYLMYVSFSSSYLSTLVTSKWTRRPRSSFPALMRSSTCSSQPNIF